MAGVSASVTVRDLGWRRVKTRMREMDGRSVKVGILAKDAGKTYDDGTTVVDVATFNEYGTTTSPKRPFLRHTADTSKRAVASATTRAVSALVAGRGNVTQSLDTLGQWYAKRIQTMIRRSKSWAAPNAPATIKRKGHSTPLIETRLLLASISHEVE